MNKVYMIIIKTDDSTVKKRGTLYIPRKRY